MFDELLKNNGLTKKQVDRALAAYHSHSKSYDAFVDSFGTGYRNMKRAFSAWQVVEYIGLV